MNVEKPSLLERVFGLKWSPLDSGLQAAYRHNSRLLALRFVCSTACVVSAAALHYYGLSKGLNPELKDSSFQVGEFVIRGYGFPGVFLAAAVVLGLWGFGSPVQFPSDSASSSDARPEKEDI